MSDEERIEPHPVLDLGGGLEIWQVDVDDLIEQDVNARGMPSTMFERLATTIGTDARLESLPLVAQTDRGLEIVSGHHRTRAARSAGLRTVHVIVDITGLDADAIKAKQLAHNSIAGTDNVQLLAKIYEAIQNVDRRLEAYVPKDVGRELPTVTMPRIDLDLDHRAVTILFLPFQAERFERALDAAQKHLPSDLQTLYLAETEQFATFKPVLDRIRGEFEIKSIPAALAHMALIVGRYLDEPLDDTPLDEEAVPLRDLFGASIIPADAANVIRQALEKLEADGDISKRARWRAIELWAADFLGTP